MPWEQITVRVSPEIRELIKELSESEGSQREVIEKAVRMLAQRDTAPQQKIPERKTEPRSPAPQKAAVRKSEPETRVYGTTPEEVENLERMTELKDGGSSYAEIAEIMNNEGRANQSGEPWKKGNVYKMFRKHVLGTM
jgi:DNA-binding transcriptional MerR regulator